MSRLSPNDPNSYSRPDEVCVTNVHLDWLIDFSSNTISGSVTLNVERKKDAASQLVLDSKDLSITNVEDEETGQVLTYSLGEANPNFGSELRINLPSHAPDKNLFKIKILYSTSPKSSALQWLLPDQTAGKKYPYLFSQCQAIHCRSLIPIQDTPSVKAPYSAVVSASKEFVVLMSALRDEQVEKGTNIIHKFRQPVCMPAYLIAIAVGALESRDVGPRTKVWSEKELVDKAEYEFAETEKMLSTAEDLCGEYVWTQYDLLILPPSFPYGGMENPCLTFVTPTLLTGDRSLVDVVAHEIAHSWTGNLVTNQNWEHFWLNEGFTMFVERKIIGRMHGESYRHLSAIGGWKSLSECIKSRGADDPLTCLVPDLTGIDPDDSFSVVPYEKGHAFIWYLETLVGGPKVFEPFLKAYLDKFKYKSISSDTFKSFLLEYFVDKKSVFDVVNWTAWWKTPGMPQIKPQFDETLSVACTKLYMRWMAWYVGTEVPFHLNDIKELSSIQVIEFLAQLLEEEFLPIAKLEKMDEIYKLSSSTNSEILFRWIRLGLRAHWKPRVEDALNMVTSQGRMKYVRPLYRDLYAWEEMRPKAIATFEANKKFMMHVSAYVVAKDLHLSD